MPLLILPNELLLIIGEGLETHRDLNALSRTDARLYHLFNGEQYSKTPVEDRNLALFWASYHGHARTVQLLLDYGVDVDSVCFSPKYPRATALQVAVGCGNEEVACLLIERRVDISQLYGQSFREVSILHVACFNALPQAVQMLLERGAKPNQRDRLGRTPLHFAVLPNQGSPRTASTMEVVRLLLERGAKQTSKDHHGQTPVAILNHNDLAGTGTKDWSYDFHFRFFERCFARDTEDRLIWQRRRKVDLATHNVEKRINCLFKRYAAEEALEKTERNRQIKKRRDEQQRWDADITLQEARQRRVRLLEEASVAQKVQREPRQRVQLEIERQKHEASRIQKEKDLAREATERRLAVQTAIAANWGHLRQSAQTRNVSVVLDNRCGHPLGRLRRKQRGECHVYHQVKPTFCQFRLWWRGP
ncbi:ankyrin [Dissoconium aciculare CBS 342.82]|uniref:Ankyrin n=1 Tax=Dissoconium aciculare CBS 342.82 TaxID=1314786 RepID=A0A6J3LT23_9PEZI|nr:ankyrin [Dissoconium aciculare CBS 342.82]KAF1818798.1 ankyrin [Dissoconium aciculare CBS 342.82]